MHFNNFPGNTHPNQKSLLSDLGGEYRGGPNHASQIRVQKMEGACLIKL
jgi:hypothetical protein